MLKLTHRYHYLFILSLFVLTACASVPKKGLPPETNILENNIEHANVVFVGETHNDYGHHLNQLRMIQISHKKWGGDISIGLEMVQQPFQTVLDQYIAGQITEKDMLRGTEWYSRWRYDFRLYRPIFDYAKQHKIPLIALNIPQAITKQISKAGIQSLSPAERKYLPELIDKSNTEYEASLRKIFGQHAHGKTFNEEGFNKFVEAQLAWDEGMALSASNYLKKNPSKRMVVLVGSGHLINRAGIPNRLERLNKTTKNRTVVILSHSEKEHTKTEADFSLKAQDVDLKPAGLIGIGMKDTNKGVLITKIIESGAAEKAGLQVDDILLKLNDDEIKTSSDVSLWRLDKKPNEKTNVQIQRGNQLLNKELVLGSPKK